MMTYLIAQDQLVVSEEALRDWAGLPEDADIEEVIRVLEDELGTMIIPQEED